MDDNSYLDGIMRDRQARLEAYKILEVDENADEQALKKAYKRACLKYHPDRNPTDGESHKKFLLVRCAYELLTKNTICPMLVEKMKSQFRSSPKDSYDTNNPWGYFLWWREQFFDGF